MTPSKRVTPGLQALSRAKGATHREPGATPQDSWNKKKPALKARFNLDVAASATTAPTPPQTAI
jgi:hypothetical protein